MLNDCQVCIKIFAAIEAYGIFYGTLGPMVLNGILSSCLINLEVPPDLPVLPW